MSECLHPNQFHKLASLIFKSEDQGGHMTMPLTGSSSLKSAITSVDIEMDDSGHSSGDSNAGQSSSSSTMHSKFEMKLYTLSSDIDDHSLLIKNKRCLLYNKLVELMPETLVQPQGNLSDFVQI